MLHATPGTAPPLRRVKRLPDRREPGFWRMTTRSDSTGLEPARGRQENAWPRRRANSANPSSGK